MSISKANHSRASKPSTTRIDDEPPGARSKLENEQRPNDGAGIHAVVPRSIPSAERSHGSFFPPAISLSVVAASIADRRDILLGVQNVYWADQGAFTGEVSVGMARDACARVALVGHSERRHVFGETDEEAGLKCAAVDRGGLTPLLCVGELLEQPEAGEAESVVIRQLRAGFSGMTHLNTRKVVMAYEPVWAIGTGKTATPQDATAMHSIIRRELGLLCGDRGRITPILYGGSVTPVQCALASRRA